LSEARLALNGVIASPELVEGRGNLVFPAFTGRTGEIAASPVQSEWTKRMNKGLLAMTARLLMLNISSKHFRDAANFSQEANLLWFVVLYRNRYRNRCRNRRFPIKPTKTSKSEAYE
jgi:hypothetical protein